MSGKQFFVIFKKLFLTTFKKQMLFLLKCAHWNHTLELLALNLGGYDLIFFAKYNFVFNSA